MAPSAKTLAFVGTLGLAAAAGAGGGNATVLGSSSDLADPRVFSPYFYMFANPDLIYAGISTADPNAAREHWINSGSHEGRQASGRFHSKQYLDRYPDLKAAFGDDFQAAVNHYLTSGASEGRLGFAEDGGPYGRWTIADEELGIFLSASTRMGGAVDSLVWMDREFINARDHGRELQIALSTDGHSECYNPTEAGSRDDSDHATSTSVIQGATTQGNVLRTSVLPAFWLGPGDTETLDVSGCHVSLAPTETSNYVTSKAVSFRPFGVPRAIEFSFSITVPEAVQAIQIESPTGYMVDTFSSYYTLDVASGALAGLSHDDGEQPLPIILATPDGSFAMGAYSPPSQGQVGYGRSDSSNIGSYLDNTHKWTMVVRPGPQNPGTVLSYATYLCVGSLSDVRDCMVNLHEHAGRSKSVQV